MKKIILVLVLLFVLPVVSHAEEKSKSKLMALVGMRIPPVVIFREPGGIPGWQSFRSFFLPLKEIKFAGIDVGYLGNEGGFVFDQIDKDMTRTILDARSLPIKLLRFDLKDGKYVWGKDANKRYGVFLCEKARSDDVIVGLMRPERGKENCEHVSRQVKMAWRVNEKTRKLEEISPKEVVCFFTDGEDECD